MNVAVKFQSANPDKPDWMPGIWPCKVIEESHPEFAQIDESWTVMTKEAYEKYVSDHKQEYEAAKPVEVVPPKESLVAGDSYAENERNMLNKMFEALQSRGIL